MNSEKILSPKSPIHSFLHKHAPSIAIAFIILGVFLKSLLKDGFGLIGQDSDDIMRLIQIKDYLAGQSWFHTDQYRLGLANGTDMHWSRIPDIPIILLTHIFDIFMPQDKALIWAFTLWPPFSALLLIYGCLVGARHWSQDKIKDKTKVFTLILLAIYVVAFIRFSPGAIDHHNLQLGFISIAGGFVLDSKFRFWSYFISGFALAISVAIGVEIYLFAAIICGFVALNWVHYGNKVKAGTQGFGLGFSVTLLLAFFGTVAPSEYGLIYCDALSLITISAGVVGALGLAILTKITSEKGLKGRVIGLGVLGLICAAVLGVNAPQCLSNPLDALPAEVTSLWLDYISEAQPVTDKSVDKFVMLPYMLFAPIIAVIVLFRHKPDHEQSDQKNSKLLLIALLIAALGFTLYQIRFFPFAYIFAIAPLGAWIAKVYQDTKLKNPDSVTYLAALLASLPLVWMLPGVFIGATLMAEEDLTSKKTQICASDAVLSSLNKLPLGTILAHPNMAGNILNKTGHRALSGNYHRNWQGISVQIQVAISDPVKAGELLLENNIDYVYLCQAASETTIYKEHNDNGFTAQLTEGIIPDYLDVVSESDLEGGDVVIFKVKGSKL